MEEKVKSFSLAGELSGALGDLGTFLPHVLGVITVAGLDPAGVFTMFGLFYIFTAAVYRLPVPVQPMKAAAAAIVVNKLAPGIVSGAGLTIGGILTLLGLTGLIEKITRVTPGFVVSGIQLYFGFSLMLLGLKMAAKEPLLGFGLLALLVFYFRIKNFPVAAAILVTGLLLQWIIGKGLSWPGMQLDFNLPGWIWPTWDQWLHGSWLVALPQLALTVTNAIILTCVMAGELYPDGGQRIKPCRLALTHGIGNLVAAPLGGIPMCHGSGGLAAHYRFGSRTFLTPALLGMLFLFFGLFLGESGAAILGMVPDFTLGVLLTTGGWELARNAKLPGELSELILALVVAVICFVYNGAAGFVAGLVMAWVKKGIHIR